MTKILDVDSFAQLAGPPTIFTAPSASKSHSGLTQITASTTGDLLDPDIDWSVGDPFAFLEMAQDEDESTSGQTHGDDLLQSVEGRTTSQGTEFDVPSFGVGQTDDFSPLPAQGATSDRDSTSIWQSKAPARGSCTLYTPDPSGLPSLMPTSTLRSDTEHRNQLRETLRGYEGLSALDSDAIEEIIDGIFELNSNTQLPTIADQSQLGDGVESSLRLPTEYTAMPDDTTKSDIRRSPSTQSITPSAGTKRSQPDQPASGVSRRRKKPMVDKYWTDEEAARLDECIGLVHPTPWVPSSTYHMRS